MSERMQLEDTAEEMQKAADIDASSTVVSDAVFSAVWTSIRLRWPA